MLLVLLTAGIAVVCVLAAGASGPAGRRTRSNDSLRRARFLARNAHEVNSGDIHRILTGADLTRDQIARTLDGAAELGYAPYTMYAWMKKFDAHTLTQVIAQRISEHEALVHISDGTLPRLDSVADFARSHGVALRSRATRNERREMQSGPRPATASTAGAPSEAVPRVFAPGDWSMEQGRTALPSHDGDHQAA